MPRLVIDTDTAGDDVTSLLFGLCRPDVDLVGITVVAGNVHLHEAVTNALITVERTGRRDVPVFIGADRPFTRPLVTAHYVHGDDGMGNAHFPPPALATHEMHAVDALIDLCDRYAGELEIIAQGPLTNIALAFLKEPLLPQKVNRLWIMGGSNNALGNITPAAEFNFYVDPEAAHIVLQAGFATTLVPWDVCVADGVLMRDELGPILEMETPLSKFYLQTQKSAWDFMRTEMGIDGISHPDALTIAMALDRRVIASSDRFFVDVEHHSELTRGYSLVDLHRVLDRKPNAEVVLAADKGLFKTMLEDLLRQD